MYNPNQIGCGASRSWGSQIRVESGPSSLLHIHRPKALQLNEFQELFSQALIAVRTVALIYLRIPQS